MLVKIFPGGWIPGSLLCGAALLIASGCGQGPSGTSTAPSPAGSTSASTATAEAKKHEATAHTHVAPHGGQVQAVGDLHFELVYEGEPGKFTLYTLGTQESQAQAIAGLEIPLQVKPDNGGGVRQATLAADPLETDPKPKASRFSVAQADLRKLSNFVAVARVPVEGETHRAMFQFAGGKPIGAGSEIQYACPMKCEKGRTYPKPGSCPVCEMKLVQFKGGMLEHADHNPKHGGVFFMAPDNWHHLEGTLAGARELRVYLYDNFTQPMSATGVKGELEVRRVNEAGDELGAAVTVPLVASGEAKYLVATWGDEGWKPPYQSEARIQFPNRSEKYVFSFDFKGVQHKD